MLDIGSPATMSIQVDTSVGLSPEQTRLQAADYILRVLALTKKREPRKALVRLAQLNALITDYPTLKKMFPKIAVFLRYGAHYCTNHTKIKRKALLFLSMQAEPIIESIFSSLEVFLEEQKHLDQMTRLKADEVNDIEIDNFEDAEEPAPKIDRKYIKIGVGLEQLKNIMPAVIAAEETRKAKVAKEVQRKAMIAKQQTADKKKAEAKPAKQAVEDDLKVISSDDAYVLEQAGRTKTRELSSEQSMIIRASVILTNTHVTELARRAVAVTYGMTRVLGGYIVMTEALVAGIARFDENGDPRPKEEITEHAKRLVNNRNRVRKSQGEPDLGIIFSQGSITKLTAREKIGAGCVNTPMHSYFLLFDNRFIVDSQITSKRWEFYRKPGTADVQIVGV